MARKIAEVFNGAIPPVCLSQIMRTVDFSSWNGVYVGCSGTFSFERAIGRAYPAQEIHGNDVSLLSHVLQSLALDQPFDFRFIGRVEHFEQYLEGRGYRDRCAAMIMVLALSRVYGSDNAYNKKHWRAFENEFERYLEFYGAKLDQMVKEIRLTDYFAGDFRIHLDRCIEQGGGFVISAPFIAGWYESWFRFINANIEWPEPSFSRWDPTQFPEIIEKCREAKIPFVAVYKSEITDLPLVAYHRMGMKPKFYVYSNSGVRSSTVDQESGNSIKPFKFKAIDIDLITAESKLTVHPVDAGYANYIKSLYMQENINFTSGRRNFLIMIDGMVAGILTYANPTVSFGVWAPNEYLYLLSDTSTTRYGRVSKLLAMLATSATIVQSVAHDIIKRDAKGIVTTVRSNMPASMKYRGIFKVGKRAEAPPGELSGAKYIIGYQSEPRASNPQELYAEWFKRHFKDDRARKVTSSHAKPAN